MKPLDDHARAALDARIDDYLDGLLSPGETRALERQLAEPRVAQALAEAIALRELLFDAPPTAPPPGLTDRIIAALEVADATPVAEGRKKRRKAPSLGRARRVVAGAGWVVRGPGRARGGREALAGVGTMRYLLAPFAIFRRARDADAAPRRPLLRRLRLPRLSLGVAS